MNGLEVVEEEESDSEGIQEDLEQLKLNEQTSPKKEPIAPVPDDGKLSTTILSLITTLCMLYRIMGSC